MVGSFEKSVKGATKIKNAPPKSKYIEHLLVATHSSEAGVAEVFRALQYRLRDSTWTVVFKGLLTTHILIREGAPDVALSFIAKNRNVLAISSFTDAQTQGRNIRRYSNYLTERGKAYRDTKTDWVRTREDKLGNLPVERGLLRETEVVLKQIMALLKCDLFDAEPETDITTAVFRLLVLDLLALFKVLNQGMIAILSHFFEMSKPDAERAHNIYRAFTKCTEYVVRYLSVARMHERTIGVDIPSLQHAPVNLGKQLEDYLNEDDFDVHRRQYIAEQQAKKASGRSNTPKLSLKADREPSPKPAAKPAAAPSQPAASQPTAAAPSADLIDFFDSIETQQPTALQVQAQAQQPIATSVITQGLPMIFQQPQQGMMMPQQTGFAGNNPFGMPQPQMGQMQDFSAMQQQQQMPFMQSQPTGFAPQQTGFQAMPQQQQQFQQPASLQPQPTGTNPFRQSMMPQPTGSPFGGNGFQQPQQQQSTNPFARSQGTSSPFQSTPSPLQAQPTGTNPFARSNTMPIQPSQQQEPQPLMPQATGVTNPFRQGDFVNHNTGMGWQHNQAPIGGGFDQIPTVPVFPRPAQQTPWQQ